MADELITWTLIHEHKDCRIIESWKVDLPTALEIKARYFPGRPVARTILPTGVPPEAIRTQEFTEWGDD
jgi:hypothetical protein